MKYYSRFWMSLLFILPVFLYGCSAPFQSAMENAQYQKQPWKDRKTQLLGKQRWNIQGAISIRVKNKSQMGSFAWQQRGPNYGIQVYGPLNLGSMAIEGNPRYVALWKGGARYTAKTPEALMRQQLGWYLPISDLFFWVRGLPAPHSAAHEKTDEFGHLIAMEQDGWSIEYQGFAQAENLDLPRKIEFDNQDIHVKMVISSWN